MRVISLGTNGWYDSTTGNTVCVFVETKTEYIIFDAGNGLHKIDRYIKTKKPIYLFLSHFHLDHVIGFHALAKFNFSQGINVYGPVGLKNFFKNVINCPYTVPIAGLKTKIKLFEIDISASVINSVSLRGSSPAAGGQSDRNSLNWDCLPTGRQASPEPALTLTLSETKGKGNVARNDTRLDVSCGKLKHSSLCLGYRVLLENKTISYCTDTGLCRNLFLLAKEADLLIAECSFKSGQKNAQWPHLNPQSVAKLAQGAKAKKLALIHFDAGLYLTLKDRIIAQSQARKIFKNTIACQDNQEFIL